MEIVYLTETFAQPANTDIASRACADVRDLLAHNISVHLVCGTARNVPKEVRLLKLNSAKCGTVKNALHSATAIEDLQRNMHPTLSMAYVSLGPIKEICHRRKIDAILVNDSSALAYGILQWQRLFPREIACPILVLARYSVLEECQRSRLNPWRMPDYWLWQLQVRCWELAGMVICDTRAMKNIVLKSAPHAHASVLSPFSTTCGNKATTSNVTHESGRGISFVFCGELNARNNVDTLVQAFSALLNACPNLNMDLWLCGPDGARPPVFDSMTTFIRQKYKSLVDNGSIKITDQLPALRNLQKNQRKVCTVFPQGTASITSYDLYASSLLCPRIINRRSGLYEEFNAASDILAPSGDAHAWHKSMAGFIRCRKNHTWASKQPRRSACSLSSLVAKYAHRRNAHPALKQKIRQPVSAVVTCFNLGVHIHETIQSLWAGMDKRRDEIIVIDDGSTDSRTLESLSDLERNHGCRVIRQNNQGVCAARRRGILETKNEFVIMCDGDDGIEPEFVQRTSHVLSNNPKVGAVYTWLATLPNTGEEKRTERIQWDFRFPWGLCSNPAGSLVMLRKKAIAGTVGYRDEMSINYGDWDLLISLCENGWECLAIPVCLGLYRTRPDSMLRSISPQRRTYVLERMLNNHKKVFADHSTQIVELAQANTDYFSNASNPASTYHPSDIAHPDRASTRMSAVLNHVSSMGLKKIAIYGAGAHSVKIAGVLARAPVDIAFFIDDNAHSDAKFMGWPVYNHLDAVAMKVDAVVISSDSKEDKLYQNATQSFGKVNIPVFRLYG